MKSVLLASLTAAILGAIALYAASSSSNEQPAFWTSLRRNLQNHEATSSRRTVGMESFFNRLPTTSPPAPTTPAPVLTPTSSAPLPAPVTNAPVAAPVTNAPVAAAPTTDAPVTAPVAQAPTTAPVLLPPTPSLPLRYVASNGNPSSAFPLAQCQGDCSSDYDCMPGLVCFQRTFTSAVPGCTGTPQSNIDYCIDPADRLTPAEITGEPTEGFGLKLYWEEGYFWQGETFDRKWCMKCDDVKPECFAGQSVFSTECVTNVTAWEYTPWQFVYLPSGAFYMKILPSDLCLTLGNVTDIRSTLSVQECSPYDDRQLFFAQNGQAVRGDKFEIHPALYQDKCLDIVHEPKFGERVFAWPCEYPRAWKTSLWNFYYE
ncbi:hypothetical protein MPSEU_000343100 [Mayamaea pseudoterrestris]|nr:hypothetical protein MPSEU_000343100 [Mayamaea pseudoterrestris]